MKQNVARSGADGASAVLVEEERLELNLEDLVPDPRQETRARAAQQGVRETSVERLK